MKLSRPLFIGLCVAAIANASCSMQSSGNSRGTGAGSANSAAAPAAPAQSPAPVAPDQDEESAGQDGLPLTCSSDGSGPAKFCLSCTPRLLPLDQCFDVQGTIDPRAHCSHSAAEIVCRDGSKELKMSLAPREIEKIYEGLPLFILAAKAMLVQKLKDKPKEMAAISAGLDFVGKNAKSLFSGRELEPLSKALGEAVKKVRAETTPEEQALVQTGSLRLFKKLNELRMTSKLSHKELVGIVLELIEVLPTSTLGSLSGKVDLSQIKVLLSAQESSKAALEAVMSQLNIKSMEELLILLGTKA